MFVQQPLFDLLPNGITIPPGIPLSNKNLITPGYSYRTQIPENDTCIILDQFYYVDIRGPRRSLWYALVQCPGCSKIFIKRRSAMHRSPMSYCTKCINPQRIRVLESTDECIIIVQRINNCRPSTALVECPICHKQFQKTRSNLVKDGHTICFPCAAHRANSGSNHYLWRGGVNLSYYYSCDWVYLSALVRSRDNHRCQFPGCNESRHTQKRALSVHHIIPFNDSQDNSPLNLISLCQGHHKWADSKLDLSVPMFDNIIMMMYGPDYR